MAGPYFLKREKLQEADLRLTTFARLEFYESLDGIFFFVILQNILGLTHFVHRAGAPLCDSTNFFLYH